MNPKYARLLSNPHARAEIEAAAERSEAGAPAPAKAKAPTAASVLELEDKGDRWVGPCPACREDGRDSKGDHLVIWPDGRFGCTIHRGEDGHDHRSRMVKLCPALGGGKGSGKPMPKKDPRKEQAQAALISASKAAVAKAIARWGNEDFSVALGQDSAPIPADPAEQFQIFLAGFQPTDLVWVGELYDHREAFAAHLRTPADHVFNPRLDLTRTWTFRSPEGGRKKENQADLRALVVEHDGLDRAGQAAFFRLVSATLGLPRLVMSTGGKGFHAHFDAPADIAVARQLFPFVQASGADHIAFGTGATRAPGAIRPETGNRQSIVWLRN